MKDWHEAISDDSPKLIDLTTSPTTVYLRKNVQKKNVKDDKGVERTEYHYQEKELTPIEYAMMCSTENAEAIAELAELLGGE